MGAEFYSDWAAYHFDVFVFGGAEETLSEDEEPRLKEDGVAGGKRWRSNISEHLDGFSEQLGLS